MASTSASPSPKSPSEGNEKSKKYDRQLRLWGNHGQAKLEKGHVCLINATATGTEILKSLVLSGIGHFTIIDDRIVTEEDIGNNFFLDGDSLGKNRGEAACRLLLELNPDVTGNSIDEVPGHFPPDFFTSFDVVVASAISEKLIMSLSRLLWTLRIPFIYSQCAGLYGWIRVQLNEHTIIESHPDNVRDDLRIDNPFPELVEYVERIQIKERDEAIKTPWLVLLYKALQCYLTSLSDTNINGGMDTLESHPCRGSYAQKKEFKKFLQNYLLRPEFGLKDSDEIYEDCLKVINRALVPTEIPEEVQQIFKNPKINLPENKFWVMCSALKDFVQEYGVLPVSGIIPDMTADSEKYISLQNAYREKALKDVDDISARCLQKITQGGLQSKINFREEEIRLFCKEAHNLRVIYGYEFAGELESPPTEIISDLVQNPEYCDSNKILYAMFRGVLRFHSEYNTFPGVMNQDVEPDITRFKGVFAKLLNEWNCSMNGTEDYIHEICRCGASEIPSVAAFIGGCVSHEVIKILTCQYVPLLDTLIYNGTNSTTSQFRVISPTPVPHHSNS